MTSNHLRALRKHLQTTPVDGVVHVEVRHEHGCAFLIDRLCDCHPKVESGTRVDAKYRPPEDDR